eukprot:2820441-Prymnesium_polylepis.1
MGAIFSSCCAADLLLPEAELADHKRGHTREPVAEPTLPSSSSANVSAQTTWPQSGAAVKGAGSFASEEALRRWLEQHLVKTGAWGQEGAKPVGKLLNELEQRESILAVAEGRVLRCLSVAKVRVQRPDSDQQLIEAKQVLPDGSERIRNTPLSEKMLAGEAPVEAAIRGVREELHSILSPESEVLPRGQLHETVE